MSLEIWREARRLGMTPREAALRRAASARRARDCASESVEAALPRALLSAALTVPLTLMLADRRFLF
jgi:hypothetical protein